MRAPKRPMTLSKAISGHGEWDWECAASGTLPALALIDLDLGGVLLFSAILLVALALIAYAIAGFWERWSRRRKEQRRNEARRTT